MTSELLRGPDRLAWDAVLRRPVRVGRGLVEGRSDRAFLLGYVATHDRDGAGEAAGYLTERYRDMLLSYAEWTDRLSCALRGSGMPLPARVLPIPDTSKGTGRRSGARALPSEIDRLNAVLDTCHQRLLSVIRSGRDATGALDGLMGVARGLHDWYVESVQHAADMAMERLGETAGVALLSSALADCSFYEPWWATLTGRRPDEIAVLVAEEFRSHWSGESRDGSVRIVEDAESFRVVLSPCGSGGAMRRQWRRDGRDLPVLAQAGPATWGRTAEVPAYCAHCGQNESTSLVRLGFAAWTTAFDSDPTAPCAWIVSKRQHAQTGGAHSFSTDEGWPSRQERSQ